MSSGNIVKLNVGGSVFQTTKSTLTKFDGMFKTMMETDVPVEKDDSGCIFIDRDPHNFRLILNFLRDGYVAIPKNDQDIKELLQEAQYYLLIGLVELCKSKTPLKNEIPMHLPVIETDNQMIQIITNPKKPVFIFHYKFFNWGTVFHSTNATCFLEKYKDLFDIYFKPDPVAGHLWCYTIHDNVPNEYASTHCTEDNKNFLWTAENGIARFLKTRSSKQFE